MGGWPLEVTPRLFRQIANCFWCYLCQSRMQADFRGLRVIAITLFFLYSALPPHPLLPFEVYVWWISSLFSNSLHWTMDCHYTLEGLSTTLPNTRLTSFFPLSFLFSPLFLPLLPLCLPPFFHSRKHLLPKFCSSQWFHFSFV